MNLKRTLWIGLILIAGTTVLGAQTVINWNEVAVSRYAPGTGSTQNFRHHEANVGPETPLDGSQMVTYRSVFGYSGEFPAAIYLGPANYPYALYLNGEFVSAYGSSGDSYVSVTFTTQSFPVPKEWLKASGNELVLETYPRGEHNPPPDTLVGDYATITRMAFWRSFFGSTLIVAISLMALMIAVYFFFLYVSNPNREIQNLFYALMALSFTLAYFEIAFEYGSASELLFKIISKAGFVLTVLFFFHFTTVFTGIFRRAKVLRWGVSAIAAAAIVVFAFQKSKYNLDSVFGTTNLLFFAPMLVLLVVMILVSAIRDRRKDSWFLLLGLGFVFAASGHDILYVAVFPESPYAYLTPYGFAALTISILFILALSQASVYRKSIAQARDLDHTNRVQSDMITRIEEVVTNLTESSAVLDRQIATSFDILSHSAEKNRVINETIQNRIEQVQGNVRELQARLEESAARIPAAIRKQIDTVETMSRRIGQVTSHMDSIYQASRESARSAVELNTLAEHSSGMVEKSRSSIQDISEYSSFLQTVLKAIEDITERTNILSINAAIEAARAGSWGDGFGVVAQEVRKLAGNSKEQVDSSHNRIQDMTKAIEYSTDLSQDVTGKLRDIIHGIKESTNLTNTINDRLADQQTETAAINDELDNLLEVTRTVELAARENQAGDEEIMVLLRDLSETFASVENLLQEQQAETGALHNAVEHIGMEVQKNLINVEILHRSIKQKEVPEDDGELATVDS